MWINTRLLFLEQLLVRKLLNWANIPVMAVWLENPKAGDNLKIDQFSHVYGRQTRLSPQISPQPVDNFGF